MESTSTQAIGRDVSEAETRHALGYLADTRDAIVEAVSGLSEAQWRFRPAGDRWSIAEVLEHLAAVEAVVLERIIVRLPGAPPRPAGADPHEMDRHVQTWEPDPTTTVVVPGRPSLAEAPPQLRPTGHRAPDDSLRHFLDCREHIGEFIQTRPDLRQHVIEQPAIGPLDGYQWGLFVAAHSERHAKQILGVKAEAGFPSA